MTDQKEVGVIRVAVGRVLLVGLLVGLLTVLLLGCSQKQPDQSQDSHVQDLTQSRTHLDMRVSSLVDYYYMVRKLASGIGELPGVQGLEDAVFAARSLESDLGHPMVWGFLEWTVTESQSARELVQSFSQLPDTTTLRSGRRVPIRAGAIRLAEAMATAEGAFMEEVWPLHQADIAEPMSDIEEILIPKEQECVAYMMEHLGMEDPGDRIPVFLVAEAPHPQAFTHRRADGGGVCFIAVERFKGSQLFEVILHEAIHALEATAEDEPTVFEDLTQRLRAAGFSDKRQIHDIIHTLVFIQAGETVRRLLDPSHVHYGASAGYYTKVPLLVRTELPVWKAYLDGELSRDEALDRIVEGLPSAKGTE